MKQRARKPALSKAELFLLKNAVELYIVYITLVALCAAGFFLFDKKLPFTLKTAVYVVGRKC